jgi:N-acetylglucosaminylphosphatidylinositol deacetylase
MEFISLLKYLFLLFNFFIIIVLRKIKNKDRASRLTENAQKTILILTAHPDDESMFFIPAIVNLKEAGY